MRNAFCANIAKRTPFKQWENASQLYLQQTTWEPANPYTLPAGIVIAAPSNEQSNCAGTLSVSNVGGSGQITFSGGQIPKPSGGALTGSCTIVLDVTSQEMGSYTSRIPSGALTGTTGALIESNSGAVEQSFTVTGLPVNVKQLITRNGDPWTSVQGSELVDYTIRIQNSNPFTLNDVGFSFDMGQYASEFSAVGGSVISSCGGSGLVSPTPSTTHSFGMSSIVAFSGGTLGANAYCDVTFKAKPSRPDTVKMTELPAVQNVFPASAIITRERVTNVNPDTLITKVSLGTQVAYRVEPRSINLQQTNTAELTVYLWNYNTTDTTNLNYTHVLENTPLWNNFNFDPNGTPELVCSSGGVELAATVQASIISGREFKITGSLPGAGSSQSLDAGLCYVVLPVVITGPGTYSIRPVPAGTVNGTHDYAVDHAELYVVDTILEITKKMADFTSDANRAGLAAYPGDTIEAVFTFKNYGTSDATNVAFTDDMGGSASRYLAVGPNGLLRNTCSGTLNPGDFTPGSYMFDVTGLTVPASSVCEIAVELSILPDNNESNPFYNYVPANEVTYTYNNQNLAYNYDVWAHQENRAPFKVEKSFDRTSARPGDIVTLTLSITNYSRDKSPKVDMRLKDVFDQGYVVAPQPNASTTCGNGVVEAVPGASEIEMTGGSFAAADFATTGISATCVIKVDILTPPLVAPNMSEIWTNTIPSDPYNTFTYFSATDPRFSAPHNRYRLHNPATAQLTRSGSPIIVNKRFSKNNIAAGEVSRVIISLLNTGSSPVDLTGVSIADNLALANLKLANVIDPVFAGNGCVAGTFAGAAGDTLFTLSNASISVGAECELSFNVVGYAGGSHINTIPAYSIVSDQGISNVEPASASIVVSSQIAVEKSFDPARVEVGEESTLTIKIINGNISTDYQGSSPSLIDPMPANLDLIPGSENTTCVGSAVQIQGSELILSGGQFNRESVCEVSARVKSDIAQDYNNIIPAGSFATVGNVVSNGVDARATLEVYELADLKISKSVDVTRPDTNSNVVFTLTAENIGDGVSKNVVVTDVLPQGYEFVSATPSTGQSFDSATNTVTWNLGDMAANAAPLTFTVTAKVVAVSAPIVAADYLNVATIEGDTPEIDLGNNKASADTNPKPLSDLEVLKSVDNPTPAVHTNVVFTVTAVNNGPNAAASVVVQDLLPAGYEFVSHNATQGTYVHTSGIWTIGTLSNAERETLEITAKVMATGPYLNTATISSTEITDPTPSNNSDQDSTTPNPVVDLAVVKKVDISAPAVDSNVTFTIEASNKGPSAATMVEVLDLLPTGYELVSATPSVGTSYSLGTGVWSIGSMAVLDEAQLIVVAKVKPSGNYENVATIDSSEDDTDLTNNVARVPTTPSPVVDLGVTKLVSDATPEVGTNVDFTITASNNGPSAAAMAVVQDSLPSGYEYVSHIVSVGSYNNGTGVWNIGSFAAQGTATMTVTAKVLASGDYMNLAKITSSEDDSNPTNNEADATTTPVPVVDLAISKVVDNPTPGVGTNVIFTIGVNNLGPSAANAVEVLDALPSGYEFVSATASVGTYNNTTGVWTIGALAMNGTASLNVTAKVLVSGDYENVATVSSREKDRDTSNNTAKDETTPTPVVNLSVTKVVNDTAPEVGANVTFTIKAANKGPSAALAAVLNDRLPSGYEYVSHSESVGTYDETTGVWTIGAMALGADETLTVTAKVLPSGDYLNIAQITSAETDSDPRDNTAQAFTGPEPVVDLSVTKTVDQAAPAVGTNVVFTITAANNGPSNAVMAIVSDKLPSGYEFVSANPSVGTYDDTTGFWSIGAFASQASATMTVTAKVLAAGDYVNSATISSTEKDSDPSNNSDQDSTVPTPVIDLAVNKTVSNATPAVGSSVIFTIQALNNGPSAASAAKVTDLLPSGYEFISATASVGTYDSASGLWTIGALAAQGNVSLTVTAKVLASGDYLNIATITAAETDSDPNNNTSQALTTPTAVVDLAVTKVVDQATPTVGTNVVFTIGASNNGPSDASSTTVQDLLPSGYEFVSATASVGAYDAITGTWTIGAFAAQANASLMVTAKVLASGDYLNIATIASSEAELDPSNNSAQEATTPTALVDLAVTKTVDNATPVVGSNVTFTVTVSNAGPSTATAVELSDKLSNGYRFVSASVDQGSYDATTGVWSVGDLPLAGKSTLTVTAEVLATGDYTNTATATTTAKDSDPSNNSATIKPEPVLNAAITMVKVGVFNDVNGDGASQAGETVTYTYSVTNSGGISLNDVAVTEAVADFSGTGTLPAPQWQSNSAGSPQGTLQPGEVATFTAEYSITEADVAAINLSNTATVSGKSMGSTTPVTDRSHPSDPNSDGPTVVVLTPANPQIEFIISSETTMPSEPGRDAQVFYTFKVTNNGNVLLNNVNIDPSSLSLPMPNLVCQPVTLAVGQTAKLVCFGNVYAFPGGEVKLTGDATGTSIAQVTVRDSSEDVTSVPMAPAMLTLEKLAGVDTAMVGDSVPYTITVINSPAGAATVTTLVDVIPAGFTYKSGSAALDGVAITPEVTGRNIIVNDVTVATGQTRKLTLSLLVGSSVRPGAHTNRARILDNVTGANLAPEATAVVQILADAVMQCSTILGRVFDDADQNGDMSKHSEERGLPNVRLVAPNGVTILTDEHGRFNVPCAAMPRAIGSNYMLKVDERTLPAGYRMTTENPRVVRVTPGMITRMDFGATFAPLVRIDVSAKGFTADGALKSDLSKGLAALVHDISNKATMVRITYVMTATETNEHAKARIKMVEQALRQLWPSKGKYKLNIEVVTQRAGVAQ